MYHALYHYRIHSITETHYTWLCILCIALYNNITFTHGSRFLVLHLEKIDIIMLCMYPYQIWWILLPENPTGTPLIKYEIEAISPPSGLVQLITMLLPSWLEVQTTVGGGVGGGVVGSVGGVTGDRSSMVRGGCYVGRIYLCGPYSNY